MGVPWYTWAIAALPIGGGIVYYVLSQLRKTRVEEIKRMNAESFIKSEIEVRNSEAQIRKDQDAAATNPSLDLGRW